MSSMNGRPTGVISRTTLWRVAMPDMAMTEMDHGFLFLAHGVVAASRLERRLNYDPCPSASLGRIWSCSTKHTHKAKRLLASYIAMSYQALTSFWY